MQKSLATRSILLLLALLALTCSAFSQISVGISVSFGPPPIPVYEQPICPAVDYIWTPGYWAYDPEFGYYWVPGTWVEAPQVGFLWTPGYWGWSGAAFIFHEGYWGPHIGFYGGINYGFGYTGVGYLGGRWEGNHFSYNTYVNQVNTTIIHNTYNENVTNINVTRVSYNGGAGGVTAEPTAEQRTYEQERHVPPVAAQVQHVQVARSNPELRASANQGRPPIAATARPGDFRSNVVRATEAGGEYKAPPARGAAPVSAGTNRSYNHASELQPHQYTPPNTGNSQTDQRYRQQQEQLASRQNQEHQKLQQRQEREDQQAAARNYTEPRKQQVEQRHSAQTQQLEQRHAAQEQRLAARQAPRPEKR
ncbi:MAG: YXWGXW repeat-containing protein [Acidobacteriaceae bacterium]|nr:YXWGXW repeat-containing protein [Acidobacteriaceae bacterium]MBV9295226.1 YXWGXW repeat-containing protein [Acidobacteriaceae bacterium]MBV9764829.1 YXWGXW repeat-containing protein [Acidobacteriaceae bacterium]